MSHDDAQTRNCPIERKGLAPVESGLGAEWSLKIKSAVTKAGTALLDS